MVSGEAARIAAGRRIVKHSRGIAVLRRRG
jgi:hypothetical protein